MRQSPTFFVLTALIALFLVRLVVERTTDLQEDSRRLVSRLLGDLVGIVAVMYFLVRPFVLQTFWIPSGSMTPTLLVGDRILVNCFVYRYLPPARGDIVVFHPPPTAAEDQDELVRGQDYVKRLIALPGERVRTDRDGSVTVDGHVLEEPWVEEERRGLYLFPECLLGADPAAGRRQLSSPLKFPFELDVVTAREEPKRLEAVIREREYLVLGDNRVQSHDGHEWGCVGADAVAGRAALIFWPPSRAGLAR